MVTVIPPRTYAQEHKKLTLLLGYTGPLQDISASTLNDGIEGSCRVTRDGTRFSATESDTDTADAALCDEGTPETMGGSNYEGTIEPFRFFNPENPGQSDEEADEIFQALKRKGTEVTFVERNTGKRFDEDWESGDEYSAFRGTVDNWQRQQAMEGFIKTPIPVRELRAELNGVVTGGSGGGGGGGDD